MANVILKRLCVCFSVMLLLGWSFSAVAESGHGSEHSAHGATAAQHGEAHGGGAHGGAEAHGGGHSGGQGIENWFSWSFGEGKKYKNGPFAFAILNFVILLLLLRKFASKPFRQYLQNRHSTIKNNLQEAAEMREQARRKLEEIKAKLDNLSAEIQKIKADVAADAEKEKARIIEEAHREADRIIQQADKTLDKDLRRTRRLLEAEAVNAAMEAAEKMIKQTLTPSDRRRLNDEYLNQIVSPGENN